MSKWYSQEAADKLVADINAALAEFQKSGIEVDVPRPLPPNPPIFIPARTDDEALINCRHGYLMDGITRSTDSQKTLDERFANYEAWKNSVALEGVPAKSDEYGILIGRIHDVSPFGVHTGTPKPTDFDYLPLQTQVDEFNKPHQGGPGTV